MPKSRRHTVAGVLACAFLTVQAAHADSIAVTAVQDATLIEDPSGQFASGSGPSLFAGRIATTIQSLRRALVRFDVATAIPSGSTIDEVRLRLHLSLSNSGPVTMRLHRVTQAWGEGASSSVGGIGAPSQAEDATWIHRFYDEVFWTSPGGDFDPIARGGAIVDQPGFCAWDSTPAMVSDVQSWLDAPAANFGWMILGDETRPQTAKRFDSRESSDALLRPTLEISYTPPCRPDPLGFGQWWKVCADAVGGEVSPCGARTFAALGLSELDACGAILASPPLSCDQRGARKLAVLVLNLCANRLQTSCPVEAGDRACSSETVGDLIAEMAALLQQGDCKRAAACGALPD